MITLVNQILGPFTTSPYILHSSPSFIWTHFTMNSRNLTQLRKMGPKELRKKRKGITKTLMEQNQVHFWYFMQPNENPQLWISLNQWPPTLKGNSKVMGNFQKSPNQYMWSTFLCNPDHLPDRPNINRGNSKLPRMIESNSLISSTPRNGWEKKYTKWSKFFRKIKPKTKGLAYHPNSQCRHLIFKRKHPQDPIFRQRQERPIPIVTQRNKLYLLIKHGEPKQNYRRPRCIDHPQN